MTKPITTIISGRPKAERTIQQRVRLSAYELAVKAAAASGPGVSVTDIVSQGTATLAAAVLAHHPAAQEAADIVLSVQEAKRRAAKGKSTR